MQQFLLWPANSLETAGIMIAALGFSGADKWVERGLRYSLAAWKRHAPLYRSILPRLLPTPNNFSANWKTALWQVSLFALVYMIALQRSPVMQERLAALLAMGEPWTIIRVISAAMMAPLALYLSWAALSLIAAQLLYFTLLFAWRGIWLLSRPPSGVLGSLGLLIALYQPLMQWVIENGFMS